MSSECKVYTVLDGRDRLRSVPTNKTNVKCDSGKLDGWYRFVGNAGTQMATSCVTKMHCGTHAGGWMTGIHPSQSEGIVSRKACFSWSVCCERSRMIRVRNCGSFFVYDLSPVLHCNLRYCGAKGIVKHNSVTQIKFH
jgi:hypothetical protein